MSKERPKPPTMAVLPEPGTFEIPEKWGDVADLMYSLTEDEKRIKASLAASPIAKQLAEVQGRIKLLEDYIVENMSKSLGDGVSGRVAKVEVYTKPIPVIDTQNGGWDKLYAYIQKTGDFHLLGKTLITTAVSEILDTGGELPPGVTLFHQVKVSLTKAKKR